MLEAMLILQLVHHSLIVLWISHLNSAPHTSWLTMCNKRGGKKIKLLLFLQHSRWIEETSAMCTVCTIHLSNFLLLTPSFPLCLSPPNPLAKHAPLYSSCWLARKTVTSTPVLCHHLALQRGVVVLCASAWCLHVCLWVACHPSVSVELIGMAAERADTNLMCQVGGIAWAAITFTDKQVLQK